MTTKPAASAKPAKKPKPKRREPPPLTCARHHWGSYGAQVGRPCEDCAEDRAKQRFELARDVSQGLLARGVPYRTQVLDPVRPGFVADVWAIVDAVLEGDPEAPKKPAALEAPVEVLCAACGRTAMPEDLRAGGWHHELDEDTWTCVPCFVSFPDTKPARRRREPKRNGAPAPEVSS